MHEGLNRYANRNIKLIEEYRQERIRETTSLIYIAGYIPADLELEGKVVTYRDYAWEKAHKHPLKADGEPQILVKFVLTREEAERVRGCGLIRDWAKKIEANNGSPITEYVGFLAAGEHPIGSGKKLWVRMILAVSGLPESCFLIEEEREEPETMVPARKVKTFRVHCE